MSEEMVTVNMTVNGVVTGVTFGPHKPAIERRVAGIQQLIPLLHPMNGFCRLRPKPFWIRKRAIVDFIEAAHGIPLEFRRRRQSSHHYYYCTDYRRSRVWSNHQGVQYSTTRY